MDDQPTNNNSTTRTGSSLARWGLAATFPTTIEDWTREDKYHNSLLIGEDPALDAAQKHAQDEGLPDIAVSPAHGKFLYLIVKTAGAKRVLEVGTLGGYSTIWLARALPEAGTVDTLEVKEKHAKVARENFGNAGVADKVRVIVGPASETITKLVPSYDLVFIDADSQTNPLYFDEAKRLVKNGGIIIVDNVVRNGRISNEDNDLKNEGVRKMLQAISNDKDIEATTVGTAGERGYDGFLYAVVRK